MPRSRWTSVLVTVAAVTVLAVNATVLVTGAAERERVDDRGDVAGAAVALAATAEPPVTFDANPLPDPDPEPEPEPPRTGPDTGPVEEAAPVELPVPEPPPEDPYAPTPEVRHGVLEIPAIGLRQPFFEGITLTAINRGPSHWPGSAMPGEVGNVVVAGHRTTYTRPFWDLQAVQPGDELVFTMADGTRHVYVLDRTEVVDAADVHIIDQTRERTATLFACHPRGSARQRIVGHFRLQPEAERAEGGAAGTDQPGEDRRPAPRYH